MAQVDPNAVITRLSFQIGQLNTEIAMRDVALDDAQDRIAELEAAQHSKSAAAGKPKPTT